MLKTSQATKSKTIVQPVLALLACTLLLSTCGGNTTTDPLPEFSELQLALSLLPNHIAAQSHQHACSNGGMRIIRGLDVNDDGHLNLSEKESVEDACKDQADPEHFYLLNDSGITWAGHLPRANAVTCAATKEDGVYNPTLTQIQDCASGRDATQQSEDDGDAGFVYTKLDAQSQVSWPNAPTWQCVRDDITGLVWLKNELSDGVVGNQGLRDADDRFTWYNTYPEQNGGDLGEWNAGVDTCADFQAGMPSNYCNTQALAERVNALELCSRRDWRLPSVHELQSLVHYGVNQPSSDPSFFPATLSGFYWTNTAVADQQTSAWAVNFEFGFSTPALKTERYRVRLVAGEQYEFAGALGDDAETNIVDDPQTGLSWLACPLGLSGDTCDNGQAYQGSWGEALLEVDRLNKTDGIAGYKDWRVPSIRELATLADYKLGRLRLSNARHLDAEIWSASPYHFYDHYSWYFDLSTLQTSYGERIQTHRAVMLVRTTFNN